MNYNVGISYHSVPQYSIISDTAARTITEITAKEKSSCNYSCTSAFWGGYIHSADI